MSAMPFVFPLMPRHSLLGLVTSLPHSYDMPHSRQHYCIEGFSDDFGNIILPGYMADAAYQSRYYFYKGAV